ncbi:MAG: Hsp20/alpha crystallin family protein [Candidatus Tectimicrobiota bacterium]
MAAPQWEPFEGLATIQQELHRLFEALYAGTSGPFETPSAAPAVEVIDTRETLVIKAQVPGMRKEQLQVTFSGGSLTLKGSRIEEDRGGEQSYVRREFRYGPFSRTIPLPVAVQIEKAAARLQDGLLEITLPKSDTAQGRDIPIEG